MKIVDWFIKRIGGYTKAEIMDREECCRDVIDLMDKNRNFVVLRERQRLSGVDVDGPVIINGSYAEVSFCHIKGMLFCGLGNKHCFFANNFIYAEQSHEQPPATH